MYIYIPLVYQGKNENDLRLSHFAIFESHFQIELKVKIYKTD